MDGTRLAISLEVGVPRSQGDKSTPRVSLTLLELRVALARNAARAGGVLGNGGNEQIMQYEELEPISREEAVAAFQSSDDTYTLCHSLLCVALHEDDWRWALPQVLRFLMHPNPEVRGVAVTCIGYLARIHRSIDVSQAMPMLEILREDPYCARRVRDALEDIRQFTAA